uniref:helix-turn-helix domain-containing protein n=1 Tax=Pedobacter schmidteae TaxID=2201271 RepID=UPI000EB5D23B|nr:helix-turn-helix transcriptional regulator [Pedobacter schmidteae]
MEKILTDVEQYVVDFVLKTRKQKGLSQKNIAYILEVNPSFINDVENPTNRAKYNLNHINTLSDHWGISPREFLPRKAFPVLKNELSDS